MRTARFLEPAEIELLDAAHYYELQAGGLGRDFLDRVDEAIKIIRENPDRWPIVEANIRRYLLHRFPYALLYRVDDDEIIIQATMHLHRRPGYCLGRSSSRDVHD